MGYKTHVRCVLAVAFTVVVGVMITRSQQELIRLSTTIANEEALSTLTTFIPRNQLINKSRSIPYHEALSARTSPLPTSKQTVNHQEHTPSTAKTLEGYRIVAGNRDAAVIRAEAERSCKMDCPFLQTGNALTPPQQPYLFAGHGSENGGGYSKQIHPSRAVYEIYRYFRFNRSSAVINHANSKFPRAGYGMSMYAVDIGAQGGSFEVKPLFDGIERPGENLLRWTGLALDGRQSELPYGKHIKRLFTRVKPGTIAQALQKACVPVDIDMLKLKVDGYDWDVLKALLDAGLQPKVIAVKLSVSFPPPFHYHTSYHTNYTWIQPSQRPKEQQLMYGASLSAYSDLVRPFGYTLLTVDYYNAVYVQSEYMLLFPGVPTDDMTAWMTGWYNRREHGKQQDLQKYWLNFPPLESEWMAVRDDEERAKVILEYLKKWNGPGGTIDTPTRSTNTTVNGGEQQGLASQSVEWVVSSTCPPRPKRAPPAPPKPMGYLIVAGNRDPELVRAEAQQSCKMECSTLTATGNVLKPPQKPYLFEGHELAKGGGYSKQIHPSRAVYEIYRYYQSGRGSRSPHTGMSMFAVDIGASGGSPEVKPLFDGYTDHLLDGKGSPLVWIGAAVDERDTPNFYGEHIKKVVNRVVPETIAQVLQNACVPVNTDMLKLDIDGYDWDVMKALLDAGLQPKVIAVELSVPFPPPFHYHTSYHTNYTWVQVSERPKEQQLMYGASLSAYSDLIRPFGYTLLTVDYYNAVYVRSEYMHLFPGVPTDDMTAWMTGWYNRRERSTQQDLQKYWLNFPLHESEWMAVEDDEKRAKVILEYLEKWNGPGGTITKLTTTDIQPRSSGQWVNPATCRYSLKLKQAYYWLVGI